MKSSDYDAVIEYLEYEHDSSGKTIKNDYGIPQLRDNFIIEGINCEPLSFNAECHKVNASYGKNKSRNEIKSHSYIISFDPRDAIDNGLTLQDVQQFGVEFVNKYMPGYQTIVCSHADGANGSGNMHCHIVINSIRIKEVKREIYMNRTGDNLAGIKHRCTPDFEHFIKAKIMEMCQERGLYQVNLLEPAKERINDREYYLSLREKRINGESYQTRKEYIRCAIRDCAGKSNSIEDFKLIMDKEYDIRVHESRGRLSYILPDREKGITERQLGTAFTKSFIDKVIMREEFYYDSAVERKYKTKDYVPPDVKKLVDIALNEKAQMNRGYEHAVIITNLKKTAETINLLSEKGINGVDALDHALSQIKNQYNSVAKEIKSIELRIAEMKNVMQLKSEMQRIQPIIKELKSGKQSPAFRKEHETDLVIYKAAKEKLKGLNSELKGFSEIKISKEVLSLTEQKNYLYEQRSQMKKDILDLENAKHNIMLLSGQKMSKQHEKDTPEVEK